MLAGEVIFHKPKFPRGTTFVVATDGTGDYSNIQSAIDALPSGAENLAGGGKIVIKEGTYNLSSTLNLNRRGIFLTGMGEESTHISLSGTSPTIKIGDGVTAENGQNIVLANLKVSASTGQTAIQLDKVQRVALEHITIRWGGTGIQMSDFQWLSLKNISMRGIKDIGIDILSDTGSEGHLKFTDVDISMNSTAMNNNASGVRIQASGAGQPLYEIMFDRLHIVNTDVDATGFINFNLPGTGQAVRGLQLNSATFEALAGATADSIGVSSSGSNTIFFNCCSWFGGSAIVTGFAMPNNNGEYTFMVCDMRTFKPTTGIGINAGTSTNNVFLHRFSTAGVATPTSGTVKTFSVA